MLTKTDSAGTGRCIFGLAAGPPCPKSEDRHQRPIGLQRPGLAQIRKDATGSKCDVDVTAPSAIASALQPRGRTSSNFSITFTISWHSNSALRINILF